MFRRIWQLIQKTFLLRKWRSLTRNIRFRWLGILSCIILILIFIISSFEIRSNESFDSVWDILYWSIVTITTVGYGDITPITTTGQILTVVLILIGVVLVSFMTASIASILTATRIREGMGLQKVDIKGHVVICGYNANIERVIKRIITSSYSSIPELVLVNLHPESEIRDIIEHFPEVSIRFIHGDYTIESTLERASTSKAFSAIILADSGPESSYKPDDRTLLATLAIKSMSQDVKVCVELLEASSEVHLRRAGVDQIVLAGEFSGFLLANDVTAPGISQAVREMMQLEVGGDIRRQTIPDDLIGMSFRDAALEFLDRFSSILIGVITEKESFKLDTILTGEKGAIDDFILRKFEEAGRSLDIESRGRVTVKLNPGNDYIISSHDYAVIITSESEKTVL